VGHLPVDLFGAAMDYPDFSLKNKVVMVTGAGRGIGRYVACGLAKYGAEVIVTGRTVDELEEAAVEIKSHGRRPLVVPIDVTRLSDIESGVQKAHQVFGRIDVLVNNAGINIPKPALEVTEEDWPRVIDTNLLGRIGQPKDVLGAVVYLASAASDLVTGHVLLVDGGWTAH
jgi:2-deoxy-D-gluconate 3-dehydrogenase